jgi:hypothetical protein
VHRKRRKATPSRGATSRLRRQRNHMPSIEDRIALFEALRELVEKRADDVPA